MSNALPTPLLVLEASTAAASVALVQDGVVVDERRVAMGVSQDDTLLPAIADILGNAGLAVSGLRAIACGSGPGSFTSLRIAASLAKGLAVAAGVDLYAVPSLLLAAGALAGAPGSYLLHADALRGERYALRVTVTRDGRVSTTDVARRCTVAELERAAGLPDVSATLVSVGAMGCDAFASPNLEPQARGVLALGGMFDAFGPVPVAEWEPDYGRVAEAQAKWEVAHGRTLPTG